MPRAAAAARLLFAGVAQAAIAPPLGLLPLHLVSWAAALQVFVGLEGRRAFFAGWFVGTSANLAIYAWLPGTAHRFGHLPWTAAAAVALLHAAAVGMATAVFAWQLPTVRRAAGAAWPLAAAAWFVAVEHSWPQLFGYAQGHAWYQVPRLFLVVSATGVAGMTFLVVAFNAVLLQARLGERAARRNAAVLALLVAAAALWSDRRLAAVDAAEAAAATMRVAVIQPNHSIPRRLAMERLPPFAFAEDLVALSREAMQSVTDGRRIEAFAWPEGALRSDPSRPWNRAVLDFARDEGVEVWTGANHDQFEGPRRVASHNSAFRIRADGALDRRYDKNILVPFGEYVPLRDVIPGFDRLRTVGLFEPGSEIPTYEAGPTRFVFMVCYEAILGDFVRRAVAGGANLIVNPTVDSWYGDLGEQHQHLMLAAAQAAQLGVPLLRPTTTGISAVVDARGLIQARSGLDTRTFLVADVAPVALGGPWASLGDWFAWACTAASLAFLVAGRRR